MAPSKKTKRDYTRIADHNEHKVKVLKKNYHVTAQTAYHITQLAIQENTSEGRIIDKIMRNYLAARGSY